MRIPALKSAFLQMEINTFRNGNVAVEDAPIFNSIGSAASWLKICFTATRRTKQRELCNIVKYACLFVETNPPLFLDVSFGEKYYDLIQFASICPE